MSRPYQHITGSYYVNLRVPKDLLPLVRGKPVHVTIGDERVVVTATTKVFVSLRTKDPNTARERFAICYAALMRHWAALRNGPKPFTHIQLCALAGEVYRRVGRSIEDNPEHGPHILAAEERMAAADVAAWQNGDEDDPGEIDLETASFFAKIQRPYGPQLLALELDQDLDTPYVKVSVAEALEDLFGEDADHVLADHGLVVDQPTRMKLLREIACAMNLIGIKVGANAKGDYSVDFSGRFPAFVRPELKAAPIKGPTSVVTIVDLVERWTKYSADKKAPATIRRYTPGLLDFGRFVDVKDVRLITSDDVVLWAEKRRDKDKVSASVVNANDIVALQTLFTYAGSTAGGTLRADNPAKGIRLDPPKKQETLDKKFTDEEIATILTLAREVTPRKGYPRASACRRWAPWICAYTGARIQEVCALEKKHVRLRDGAYVIHFPKTKEGIARWVVVHEALHEEGFIEFCRASPEGPLFCGDKPQKDGATRCAAEQRASEMAAWIRSKVTLAAEVSPNHAWRHTFITYAREAKICPPEMIDAITGHNRKKNASAGYYSPTVRAMAAEITRFPRYTLVGEKR